jgi:hypothetical protein
MTIFLSSTCYDLTDLRAEVEKFLTDKGHTLMLSDRSSFHVDLGKHRHDVCIDNVGKCDFFVLVIDSRYGAEYYKDKSISITWAEFREAMRTGRQAIALVRREVFNERQSCRHNQKAGNPFTPFFADNIKTFDLMDEVQRHESGIWMQPFDNSLNVKEKLENIYATKHSLLNPSEPQLQISSSEIPLTALSGSTASFIMSNYPHEENENVKAEILQSAIDKIPENVKPWGEILGFESIPNYSNDYFYFVPLRHTGDEGEIMMGISPTALGRSVRFELQGALKKIKDENNAIGFFTDTVKRKPIFCRLCEFEGKSYIVGIYNKPSEFMGTVQHISVLNLFADKWQISFDKALDEFECYPELSDNSVIIIHDKKVYFYFERIIQHIGTMNNGLGVAEFSVVDFENKTVNTLLYSGKYRNQELEGEFDFSLLEKNPNSKIYEFILEQGASKSKYIYRTPKDYNIDDIENYIEKWEIENPNFYLHENGIINFFFYDESILWDIKQYGSIDVYKANISHVENDNYIIFYYFAGPILAIRKAKNKYFVVLVPQGYGAGGMWGLRSINSVAFLTSETIFAKNDYESYEINLTTGQYTRKYFGT